MRLGIRSLVLSVLATASLSLAPAFAQRVTRTEWLPQGSIGPVPGGEQPVPGLVLPRGTLDLRMEPRNGGLLTALWTQTVAPVFVNIPKMSASFVASEADTQVAIQFSAEARTDAVGKRMFVRALIDGVVADPADVVFTEGSHAGARTFTFTGEVGPGIHTVEMQWLVDPGAAAYVRAATLLLRHGTADDPGGTVKHRTPPSGNEPRTTDPTWLPVPDGSTQFWLPAGAEPIVTFSAEAHVLGVDKRMFVRAKIDGNVLSPGDVVFAQRSSRHVHTMRFTGPAMAPGLHTATIEWLVDSGGVATVGDRTLLVTAFPQSSVLRHDLVVAPSGPQVSTSSSSWSQVPDLSALVPLPDNAELGISFSGEVMAPNGTELEMRLMANGQVVAVESAVLAENGYPFETMSFSFDRKHLFLPPNTLTGVWLEWRANGGTVFMGDRAMEVVIEKGLVPDVAEAPPIGGNDPVEAAIGPRKLLTIIHYIPRDPPNNVVPTVGQVSSALFGVPGMSDYYVKVSGSRFGFVDAGVVLVPALKSEDHYWNHGPFGCGQPMQDGYAGGHAERWAEAIDSASATIDFSTFDTDQNGVVEAHELAILIIAPQASPFGTTRALDPYCNGAAFVTDGVIIPAITEWFTSDPLGNWEVAAHELGHLVLGLGDQYTNNFDFDTEAGRMSMMADNNDTTSHFDPVQKLALGWIDPLYAPYEGTFDLVDVKHSGETLILPRDADGDGKEFFALEVRISSFNDPFYDTGTGCNGIIVWHGVEEPSQNQNPPPCMSVGDWANVTSNARRGIRLVRPNVTFGSGLPSSWDAGDYDLLDFGLNCPPVVPRRNALLWADGDASGYAVRNFSAGGPVMSFDVELP